jgi:hypothetical protein
MMVRNGVPLMSRSGGIDEEGKLVMEAGEKMEKGGATASFDRQID